MGNTSSIPSLPFRFLDLPAEMRNNIYFLVLQHDRQTGSKATPALLCTCKQVYTEAIGVLNSQSTLSVKVSVWPMYFLQDKVVVVKDDISCHGALSQSTFLRMGSSRVIDSLPPRIGQIRNLHLHFVHAPYYVEGVCKNAGRASDTHALLKSLVNVLGEHNNVPRNITCAFELTPHTGKFPRRARNTPERLELKLMFEPLYDLPPATMVKVEARAWRISTWQTVGSRGGLQNAKAIHAWWEENALRVQRTIDQEVMPRIASRLTTSNE